MTGSENDRDQTAAQHLAFGWWLLVASVLLGTTLEAFHALKLGLYLDVANETRRLLFTLAHAHGALLGLANVAFALSLPRLPALTAPGRALASRTLQAGSLLLPAGFLLGGVFAIDGDPGLAVLLAPVGAALVLVAVLAIALATRRAKGA